MPNRTEAASRKPSQLATGRLQPLRLFSTPPRTVGHLPSPRFLYSVNVLIALSLGEYRVIDRSDDPKRKLQLTVL